MLWATPSAIIAVLNSCCSSTTTKFRIAPSSCRPQGIRGLLKTPSDHNGGPKVISAGLYRARMNARKHLPSPHGRGELVPARISFRWWSILVVRWMHACKRFSPPRRSQSLLYVVTAIHCKSRGLLFQTNRFKSQDLSFVATASQRRSKGQNSHLQLAHTRTVHAATVADNDDELMMIVMMTMLAEELATTWDN